MEAPGLPNYRFWQPKIAIFVSRVTATNENATKNNLQKPNCFRTFHRETKTLQNNHVTINKPNKANELVQHSHHYTTLFPRVGAGDRGRSP